MREFSRDLDQRRIPPGNDQPEDQQTESTISFSACILSWIQKKCRATTMTLYVCWSCELTELAKSRVKFALHTTAALLLCKMQIQKEKLQV